MLDTTFLIGFIAAAALFGLLYALRRPLAAARDAARDRVHSLRAWLTAGTERHLRDDVLRHAQGSHLGGSLFPLDAILLPPRLLVPPPPFDPTAPPPDEEMAGIIPIVPDCLELAAMFQAPALSLDEALAGEHNLLILGGPGSGKTTLLAALASRAARATDDDGPFGEGVTPLFVHAADLALPATPEDDLEAPLIAAAQARASAVTAPALPRYLRQRLRHNRCVVLLDGLDELAPAEVAQVAAWLAKFVRHHDQHRVIAAAGLSGYGPLLAAGLAPALVAPWGPVDYASLLQKWAVAWEEVARARKRRTAVADTDVHLLLGWLTTGNQGRTIFEVTLKAWAALAGDSQGKRPVDWLAAYVRRHGVKPAGERALAQLAAAMLARIDGYGLPRAEAVTVLDKALAGPGGKPLIDSDDFLDDLIGRRLLARHGRDRITFQHALAAAYCAAAALAIDPEATTPGQTPLWERALYFFGGLEDLTPIVARRLGQPPDVLHSDVLASARWLRDAPAKVRWRSEVLRRLSRLFLDTALPETLRLRALAGFLAAGDASVLALFKQALANPDPFTRRLGALGLGAMNEPSAIPALAGLFNDPYLDVRWAAVLALSAISHQSALEVLTKGLLSGDDNLRRACAEALARNAEEGHPVLRDAIAHDNLSVRRAAVYGLAATGADWAYKILEQVQHAEQEWFVRTAAQDVLAQRNDPAQRAPRPVQPPEAQGWLIAWAATQSLGVPPGRAAVEVLNRALREGDEAIRRAAADALGRLGEPHGARELYGLLTGQPPLVIDTAFRALANIAAASGQRLAAPA